MTTTQLRPEDVELEASYEIDYQHGYRIVTGYKLVELAEAHRLPSGCQVHPLTSPIGVTW